MVKYTLSSKGNNIFIMNFWYKKTGPYLQTCL